MEENKTTVVEVEDYTDEERDALNDRIDEQYKKIIAEGKYKDLLLRWKSWKYRKACGK